MTRRVAPLSVHMLKRTRSFCANTAAGSAARVDEEVTEVEVRRKDFTVELAVHQKPSSRERSKASSACRVEAKCPSPPSSSDEDEEGS